MGEKAAIEEAEPANSETAQPEETR
jgi:hypothetical protein